MGYRLPLESLPVEANVLYTGERDPFEPRGPLPDPRRVQRSIPTSASRPAAPYTAQRLTTDRSDVVRTALCVEPRGGRLYVFVPPTRGLEEYLDLVAALEATAAATGTPILVEGYPPPTDARLHKISITPDPGVLEVNIHPSSGWDELCDKTEAVYEAARQSRLGAEKFMLDGRHAGSGGGNHITLGGRTPADSPFLRRPDLLKSFVGYWHNHPALSYLFSGWFIGPTSQSPRVDEGRFDMRYELETAMAQVPSGGPVQPWIVDRVFRNILVDVTGNTHRAEFCVDKLYAPESASGRQGLLEMRAMEMPPHYQMSLAQQLLVRALVARFWRHPYDVPLVAWGTDLHDRFMLPHYVQQDMQDVARDMQRAGFAIDADWFEPHAAFRFPFFGLVNHAGVELELRQAIEPWYVLGEEPGMAGTVRNVDSSVERLQVRVQGLTDTRHVVTCNGRRVPLHGTGTVGEAVAGVRYRAWQPPSCLHPTIPVHTPLVFDVVDTWSHRSLGGCAYHVSHPGGRAYDTFPVNENEAEARRLARFFSFGHTPGPVATPPVEVNRDFPVTLDLRRPIC
jgi:uncharacterized protein (DUF2126 family)